MFVGVMSVTKGVGLPHIPIIQQPFGVGICISLMGISNTVISFSMLIFSPKNPSKPIT